MKKLVFEIKHLIKLNLDLVDFPELESKKKWVQKGLNILKKHTPRVLKYLSKQSVISSLKDFSRHNENQKPEWVNLKAVVDQVIIICGSQITKNIKSFVIEIPPGLPPVLTDSQSLKQILVNILINATQAADKVQSSLKISAASGNSGREHTIIEISDNGCGMDDITRQKLFDPFFTTKSETRGTGLGLYICYNLVEDLGGRIEVESKPGEGSTFRVIIPNMEQHEVQ